MREKSKNAKKDITKEIIEKKENKIRDGLRDGSYVPNKTVITELKRSDNINTQGTIFFREGTTASIIYYLYLKYKEKTPKAELSAKISLNVLDLLKTKTPNPFKASKNPSARTPRIISRIRELEKLNGNLDTSKAYRGKISKEVLSVID